LGRIKKIIDFEKIAAGEVVERPASVVKELLENSIDAEAKSIKIIVKNAGKTLIQVIDDGYGIERDDVELAFERYTSGKIEKFDDLDSLSTLGFRGEALSSIAVVSQVELITRIEKDALGTSIIVNDGEIKEIKKSSAPIGTNISVKNLFYNIPARRKFLKSDKVELGHITDIITRYALAFPQIHFQYQHNQLDILNCPSSDSLKDMVFHIYGKKTARKMYEIDYSHPSALFKLSGLLGDPDISKKKRGSSSLFVNRRYVISDRFFEVINSAYKGFLMIGRYPFFILNLEIEPSTVDFNIHPKKLTIRFNNEKISFPFIESALRAFLEEQLLPKKQEGIIKPLVSFSEKDQILDSELTSEYTQETEEIEDFHDNNMVEILASDQIQLKEKIQTRLIKQELQENEKLGKATKVLAKKDLIITDSLPMMRLISDTGQLSNNTYIIFESEDDDGNPGILLLDQHAASERIMKERYLKQYNEAKIEKQLLISPIKLDISPAEVFFLREHLNEINKFGFDLEDFGGNTFVLRAIPAIFQKIPRLDVVKDMIEEIVEMGKQQSFSQAEEDIINYLACHKSIRGGDVLRAKDIKNLVIDLSKCSDPKHCAHGRPTFKFISFKELDKMFKRIA